ncbi:MAG: hypothetical protein K9G70_10330 [Prolixibacteraceae bacterium]|nr:hypothetical protein [Prolixibacteraceae bacterium]
MRFIVLHFLSIFSIGFLMYSCSEKEESYSIVNEWEIVSVNNVSVEEYFGDDIEIILNIESNGKISITHIVTYNISENETSEGDWLWEDDNSSLKVVMDGDIVIWQIEKLTTTELWFHDKTENALFKCEVYEDVDVIEDELNDSSLGNTIGITYKSTPNNKGAVFSLESESRIEYPFSSGLPIEGTIEMLVKIESGYSYDNYELNYNKSSAIVFNTGPSDVWYEGAIWFSVSSNGAVSLTTALTAEPTSHTLKASNTDFSFNEWHIVAFSYGREGQFIKIDDNVVASNSKITERLTSCGDRFGNRVVPAIGEAKSVFWANNRYDQGFEGIVDCFRASNKQMDWKFK